MSVRWSIDASTTEPTINFHWQERGGPEVTPPKRKGFGTVLLERAVATAIPPRFDYSPKGFSYEVKAVLAEQRSPNEVRYGSLADIGHSIGMSALPMKADIVRSKSTQCQNRA